MNRLLRLQRRPTPGLDRLPGDMHPLLRRIYAARNVGCAGEISYGFDRLLPWQSMGGTAAAADLLAACIAEDQKILIVGDYDADGATATALAVKGLRALGARHVDYLVPDRFRHGYGLTPAIVALAAQQHPRVMMTVDNGIAAIEAARQAAAAGIPLLITDHHLPGPELPAAAAIVNPNLEGDAFPSKCLSGVGVMFYVLIALRARLRENGWFERRGSAEPSLAMLLDLVALGTVADVVPLDFNNRLLVAQGLARIQAGKCAPGIAALLRAGRRDPRRAQASDLGFAVAPRLNAAGRMEDMRLGIECLLCEDPAEAQQMAARLDALNRERREIQEQMALQALAQVEAAGDAASRPAFCLFEEGWHPGVVGVVAARIKDRVCRPVFAFAREQDGSLKGSGRSVDGVHLRDALAGIAERQPGLMRSFGGHAMAAGVSLDGEQLPLFTRLLEEEIAPMLPAEGAVLLTDGELEAADFCLATAHMLREAGPWGREFPEPLFDGVFPVLGSKIMAGRHLKLSLAGGTGLPPLEAVAFNAGDAFGAAAPERVCIAYRLDVNEFRGRQRLQLLVEHLSKSPSPFVGGAIT